MKQMNEEEVDKFINILNQDIYSLKAIVDNYPILKDAYTKDVIYPGDSIRLKSIVYCEKEYSKSRYILKEVFVTVFEKYQKGEIGRVVYLPVIRTLGLKLFNPLNNTSLTTHLNAPLEKYMSFIHCRIFLKEKIKKKSY